MVLERVIPRNRNMKLSFTEEGWGLTSKLVRLGYDECDAAGKMPALPGALENSSNHPSLLVRPDL